MRITKKSHIYFINEILQEHKDKKFALLFPEIDPQALAGNAVFMDAVKLHQLTGEDITEDMAVALMSVELKWTHHVRFDNGITYYTLSWDNLEDLSLIFKVLIIGQIRGKYTYSIKHEAVERDINFDLAFEIPTKIAELAETLKWLNGRANGLALGLRTIEDAVLLYKEFKEMNYLNPTSKADNIAKARIAVLGYDPLLQAGGN